MNQVQLKDVTSMGLNELRYALFVSEERLNKATLQINNLDNQINYLRKLFRRAEKNNLHAIRYNLRMQLSISSGVKVMYHQYAEMMESRVNNIKARLSEASSSSSHTTDETPDDSDSA